MIRVGGAAEVVYHVSLQGAPTERLRVKGLMTGPEFHRVRDS